MNTSNQRNKQTFYTASKIAWNNAAFILYKHILEGNPDLHRDRYLGLNLALFPTSFVTFAKLPIIDTVIVLFKWTSWYIYIYIFRVV